MQERIYTNHVELPIYQESLQDKLKRLGATLGCVVVENSIKHMIFESLNQKAITELNTIINANNTNFFNARAAKNIDYLSRNEVQPNYLRKMLKTLSEHYELG